MSFIHWRYHSICVIYRPYEIAWRSKNVAVSNKSKKVAQERSWDRELSPIVTYFFIQINGKVAGS